MLTVTFDADAQERVEAEAARRGTDASSLVRSIVDASLRGSDRPAGDPATISLLKRWDAEDADADPAELERQRADGEEFMRNLDRNRRQADGPAARPLWP